MQQEFPTEAVACALAFPGGRADVVFALLSDVAPIRPSQRELQDAPAQPRLREAFLARRGFARRVIARRLGCAVADVEIARQESGAPGIVAPACGLHLSLSGRDGLAAVAVAERPVGVDIEPVGAPFEPPLHVLHPRERGALATSTTDAHDMLLRLWTAKEAYLKALGLGLSREPAEIEIRLAAAASVDLAGRGINLAIFDCGAQVALAAGLVERRLHRGRPLILACVVAPT